MPRVSIENFKDLDKLTTHKLSDIDSAGATKYFGCVDIEEDWYILQLTDTTARYCHGKGEYTLNWAKRNTGELVYDYFFNIF